MNLFPVDQINNVWGSSSHLHCKNNNVRARCILDSLISQRKLDSNILEIQKIDDSKEGILGLNVTGDNHMGSQGCH